MLNLNLYNLKKLRNYAKKNLLTYSMIVLPGTVIMPYFIYNYISNHEQILEVMKNSLNFANQSTDILFGNLVVLLSGIFINLDILSYQELQKYLAYDKEINSYQRRLKNNHK